MGTISKSTKREFLDLIRQVMLSDILTSEDLETILSVLMHAVRRNRSEVNTA